LMASRVVTAMKIGLKSHALSRLWAGQTGHRVWLVAQRPTRSLNLIS